MENNMSEEEKEKLRLENEIRKIKLELENGAKFIENPDMEALPPEIENEFLNYIEQFEKMRDGMNSVSVYEKIGKPAYNSIAELSHQGIETELGRLKGLLEQQHIHIETIYDVADSEMYRFITEEFFNHDIFEIEGLQNIMMHFTYEEFHPNRIQENIEAVEDFITLFFDKKEEEERYKEHVMDIDGVNEWLQIFRDSYQDFDLREINVSSVHMDEELNLSNVSFYVLADAYTAGRTEKHVFDGTGTAVVVETDSGLKVKSVTFPKAK